MAADDNEDDLDSADADEDAESTSEAFLEEIESRLRIFLQLEVGVFQELRGNASLSHRLSVGVTNVPSQLVSSYGPPYGRRRHTVHTVEQLHSKPYGPPGPSGQKHSVTRSILFFCEIAHILWE